jgi:hypothetical protein
MEKIEFGFLCTPGILTQSLQLNPKSFNTSLGNNKIFRAPQRGFKLLCTRVRRPVSEQRSVSEQPYQVDETPPHWNTTILWSLFSKGPMTKRSILRFCAWKSWLLCLVMGVNDNSSKRLLFYHCMCYVWSWVSTSTLKCTQLKGTVKVRVGKLEGMEFWVFGYRIFLTIYKSNSKRRPSKCLIIGIFFGQFKNGNIWL